MNPIYVAFYIPRRPVTYISGTGSGTYILSNQGLRPATLWCFQGWLNIHGVSFFSINIESSDWNTCSRIKIYFYSKMQIIGWSIQHIDFPRYQV